MNRLDLLHYEDVQGNFIKAEFGIRLLTYLHTLDIAAFALQSVYSPRTDSTDILHYEMMMLIF